MEQGELFTTAKDGVSVFHADSVEVVFRFQELLGDDRPLYAPEFRFTGGAPEDETRDGLKDTFVLRDYRKLIIRSGRVFCLDQREGRLIVLKEDSNTSFFLNLLLSKSQGFLAADIRGVLRLAKDLNNHCLILNENYPPVSIRRAEPACVLKLRSRQDKTELFFFFRYGSTDIAYQNQTFWLPPEAPDSAGVLLIQKRNRERESELVQEVVERFYRLPFI